MNVAHYTNYSVDYNRITHGLIMDIRVTNHLVSCIY